MKQLSVFLGSAVLLASAAGASEESGWNHYLTGYFMGAAMNGDVAVKGIPASVDVPFSDIWSNLEAGAMFNYRAERDRLSLGADLIYMGLGGTTPGDLAEVDLDQWMVEGNVGWRVSDTLEVLAGLRYNDMSTSIQGRTAGIVSVSGGKSWVDPFVGGRLWIPISRSLTGVVRGDVGGFGVGSDLAWQLGAYLKYQASNSLSIIAGYRHFDMDYEEGELTNRFAYDMTISGPTLGLAWRF